MNILSVKKGNLLWGLLLILGGGFVLGFFTYSFVFPPASPPPSSVLAAVEGKSVEDKSMDGMIKKYLTLKRDIITKIQDKGEYRCCLKKVCSRCIMYHHHDGTTHCPCANDVLAGKAPCGECIGEILEGEGDPVYAKSFAKAIAEKVGEEHLGTLRKIIADKYNVPVEEQK